MGGVLRTDEYEEQSNEALAQMRTAKTRLLKELRFADQLVLATSGVHQIQIWLDLDEDEAVTPSTGETVWWTLQSDGSLVRSDDAGASAVHATGLVWDAAAGPDSSRFQYDVDGSTVTILLVGDVDVTDAPEPIRLETRAPVRNM